MGVGSAGPRARGGQRQAEPSGNGGNDGHNGSDYEHTELLEGPDRRVQPAGEIVDGVEEPFLPAGHCSVADDQNARHEHTETGRGKPENCADWRAKIDA